MKKSSKIDLFRAALLTLAVEGIKPLYAVLFQRDKKPWPCTMEELEKLPGGTLGHELSQFLKKQGFQLIPLYENHDVYHVLLGYEAEVTDEAAMQFFLLGNRKITPSVFITVVASLLILPEFTRKFIREYRRGRRAAPIGKWEFQCLLNEQITELQDRIFKQNHQYPSINH